MSDRGYLGKIVAVVFGAGVVTGGYAEESVSQFRLQQNVEFLASEDLQGRGYDTLSSQVAARWLAARLDEIGLEVPEEGRIQTQGEVQNVLGLLPGEDSSETIVIAAHYDHLGVRGGEIYYGADDNASGCAAVLEIARILARSEFVPKRNILFAFFDREEIAKKGSTLYISKVDTPYMIAVHKPPVFMLNFDMVGRMRNNQVELSGFSTSSRLDVWVDQAEAMTPGLNINRVALPAANGDHAVLAAYGIPVLKVFTGNHADYHLPSDTPDKINYDGLADITRLGLGIVQAAATDGGNLDVQVNPNSPIAVSFTGRLGLKFTRNR